VSYDLRLERILDAPPELVFDTIVDPAYADEIYSDQVPGFSPQRFEIDLRVGGTWTIDFGPRDGSGPNDVLTSVFTEIDRPRRIVYDTTMYIAEWGRSVSFTETLTLEDQGGKTLLTVVQSEIEREADRDAFMDGTPGWLDAVQRIVERRAREGTPS
jgi:uncharacterized protein YndB with AHSA1/START domain